MKLQISASGVPLEGTVEKVLIQKLQSDLEKYLKHYNTTDIVADVRVEKRTRWGYKVTFDLMLPGNHHLFSEEKHENFHTAVNSLRDEVKRSIRKLKEKKIA